MTILLYRLLAIRLFELLLSKLLIFTFDIKEKRKKERGNLYRNGSLNISVNAYDIRVPELYNYIYKY